MSSICFIGAGNMASSIIGGLIAKGILAEQISASDPNTEALSRLQQGFGIKTFTDNQAACKHQDVVVLAVKPQVLRAVAQGIASALNPQALVISIAAGISSEHLCQWLGKDRAIVRCMPNTPALVKQGASGLYANTHVSTQQKQLAEDLLTAVGITVWLDEQAQMDPVTAVSGSGPGYFFLLMEAMIDAGTKQGLSPEQARQLTLQTAAGAAKLAQQSDVDVAELRRRVSSPGGTTEQAILSFEQAGFHQIVDDAMVACAQRSKAMALEFT
ncbi:MAG: pyrroline-5-carboxylate reductase [Pseudomonadota bacterium]